MLTSFSAAPTLVAILVASLLASGQPAPRSPIPSPWPYAERLAMTNRAVLHGVAGRIEHMDVDLKTGRLHIAARAHGSLQSLNISNNANVQTIRDLSEPQDVLFLGEQRLAIVSCGGDATCRIYAAADDGTLSPRTTVALSGEPDALRYDAESKLVYVCTGMSILSFDPATGEKSGGEIKLPALGESFIIEEKVATPALTPAPTAEGKAETPAAPATVATRRMFVNLPSEGKVAVVDLADRTVKETWSLPDASGNFEMAFDAASSRLFVACRRPAKLVVLNAANGNSVASLSCVGDAGNVWYDAETRRVLVTGGDSGGKINAFHQESADSYKPDFTMTTAAGARTSILIPERRQFIVTARRWSRTPRSYSYT